MCWNALNAAEATSLAGAWPKMRHLISLGCATEMWRVQPTIHMALNPAISFREPIHQLPEARFLWSRCELKAELGRSIGDRRLGIDPGSPR